MINAAGKAGDFDLAHRVFQQAKSDRNIHIDVVTYSSMIDAAGKAGNSVLAHQVFKEAKKNRKIDVVTYNSMIDALYVCSQYDQALVVFKELLSLRKPYTVHKKMIDLHNMSYCTAILALHLFFQDTQKGIKKQQKITIVVGQYSGRGVLQHALACFARHHVIEYYADPYNAGKAFMKMHPWTMLKSDFPQIDSVPDEHSLYGPTTSRDQFPSDGESKASSLMDSRLSHTRVATDRSSCAASMPGASTAGKDNAKIPAGCWTNNVAEKLFGRSSANTAQSVAPTSESSPLPITNARSKGCDKSPATCWSDNVPLKLFGGSVSKKEPVASLSRPRIDGW